MSTGTAPAGDADEIEVGVAILALRAVLIADPMRLLVELARLILPIF